MRLKDYSPALKFGAKIYPDDTVGLVAMNDTNGYWFVDGDVAASGQGTSWEGAFKTIQEAVTAASAGDTIFIGARTMAAGATDPVNYAEAVTVPAGKPSLSLIGVSRGRTQGGLPQIKAGSGSSPLLTLRSPGCLVANLGFNGGGSTGGGVKLDDDGSTKTAFGTTITDCHFKNCRASSATDGSTGGAITIAGGSWQLNISNNLFYKNVGGIIYTVKNSDPQDVVIQGNTFAGTVATTDVYIMMTGSALDGIVVTGNNFASALPNIGSGANKRYVILTGCTGIFSDNYVSGSYTTSGFGAASAAGVLPTTMGIAHNYSDAGLIVRE